MMFFNIKSYSKAIKNNNLTLKLASVLLIFFIIGIYSSYKSNLNSFNIKKYRVTVDSRVPYEIYSDLTLEITKIVNLATIKDKNRAIISDFYDRTRNTYIKDLFLDGIYEYLRNEKVAFKSGSPNKYVSTTIVDFYDLDQIEIFQEQFNLINSEIKKRLNLFALEIAETEILNTLKNIELVSNKFFIDDRSIIRTSIFIIKPILSLIFGLILFNLFYYKKIFK